ncbi:uncharacterized protein LOC120083209 [Benincasa hispida]|uniref:uncharacterized protein LOC120083209 n=1 Tax=Benincasa hispida TaxID=102211 RepID=UPI0019011E48|nr:uncharacterized protein LOC120083209 [Benincasa hispida]
MAKGRKLGINRNERFLGSYSNGYAQGSYNGDDSSELREEDVWSIIDNKNSADGEDENYGNVTVRTRRRSTPRDERKVGGVSIAFEDSGRTVAAVTAAQRNNPRGRHVSASAPVNVPDWSKILRAEPVESLPEMDDGGYYNNDEAEMVPPHEYLAREYARSRNAAAATSVFEGVGRTLKGRDMRRVRDAVWNQTGFDG